MTDERLKPGRKPLGDKKRIQIAFYTEKHIEDFLGKAYCKEFCQQALQEEYNRKQAKPKTAHHA
jgi:hypothetical protein